MKLTFPRTLRIALPAVLLALLAPVALAMPAHIVASVHMRAGPSIEYPAVMMLIPGTPLEVYGCEQAYAWCDVQAGPNRGWVDADYVQIDSGGHPVILAGAGVAIGVPIVTFTLGTYWGNYYRARPWYGQRARYMHYWRRYPHGVRPPRPRPPPMRPPPRPRPPGGKPPPKPPGNGAPTPQP